MGIEGINSRIADIQSRILALQTQPTQQTQGGKSAPVQTSSTAGATTGAGTASTDSFASYLQNAVSATPPGSAATAVDRTYQLNGKGVPVELAAYGNGKVPASALEQVGDTRHRLWAPAAESLTRMIGDAKQAGVHIGITDSYRPYAEQVDLAQRKGLYSQGGLAAKPGASDHGWGMATDLDLNGKALSWMRDNGAKYGFVNNVSRESWHWAYKPKNL